MPTLLFVYGTLKAGFPNFAINAGTPVPGRYRTVEPLPLMLVGERSVPWLLNTPGQGLQVHGELYEVDAPTLAAMDVLEDVDQPGGYVRVPLRVQRVDAGGAQPPVDAQAYLKPAEHLTDTLPRVGPLADYTLQHAALYSRQTG